MHLNRGSELTQLPPTSPSPPQPWRKQHHEPHAAKALALESGRRAPIIYLRRKNQFAHVGSIKCPHLQRPVSQAHCAPLTGGAYQRRTSETLAKTQGKMPPGKMLMDDKNCFLVFSNEKVLALHKGAEERRAVSGHEMRNPSTGPPGCVTPAPGYAGARSSEATSSQCLDEEGANRETSTLSLPSASSVATLSPGNASFRPAKLTLQPTNRLVCGARAMGSVLTRGIHTGGLDLGCAWPFRELRKRDSSAMI